MHLHLIGIINLWVKLPEGKEILVLNYRIIPLVNDNGLLQTHLPSGFTQTPVEE